MESDAADSGLELGDAATDELDSIPTVHNKGKDCWYKCGRKSGDCKFCGSRGACCRKGWKNSACDQATAPTKHHMCVYSNTYSIKSRSASATTVKNLGKWC